MDNFNGPRLTQQTHPGQGGALVGDLLNHEERNAPIMADVIRDTARAVIRMEKGDARLSAEVLTGIMRLSAGGGLPKSGREIARLLRFRSENGAVRFVTISKAALQGVAPVITPLRRPSDPPKSTPAPIRYGSWPEAVTAQGVTACYNTAKAALSKSKPVMTRAQAFAKIVNANVTKLQRLSAFGDVRAVAGMALADTPRLLSERDIEAFYTGPAGLMERGDTWDKVLAESVDVDEADTTEDEE